MTEASPDHDVVAGPVDGVAEVDTIASSRRNTAVLVVFTAVTNLADGVMKIALPLVATTLTRSPALISGVMLSLSLPWLLTALHIGVLVDRADRRKLVWLANGVQVLMVGVLLGLAVADLLNLPTIYVCGAVLGVAEVLAMTAAAALVPDVVAVTGRERANALVTGAETVCQEFAGPFVGGLLVGVGAAFALGATLVGYALTAALLALLVYRFRGGAAGGEGAAAPSVRAQIGEGLGFLWRHRLLRMLAVVVAVLGSCWGAWFALMPLYATGPMGLTAADYGLLVGALGVGGVGGTLVVGGFNRLFGRRWAMMINIFLTSAMMAVPAMSANKWAVGCAAVLGGMGGTLWTVNVRTVMQTLVPSSMMGRFGAVFRLFAFGSTPVGAAVAGALAEWSSAPTAMAVLAAACLAVFVPVLRVFTPAAQAEIDDRLKQP
ncbi:MFS transporter [Streptomyces antimicrobicus]|uniref:MFS transporter n=1 Tax=Streptomyces antimicrobicus TaxID=2883108 RepID=A0ABS8B9F1_9ACTN|nr:MFS transporter [Streptomyces antimicrobicus]MCB5181243.1 MFS transporter [Streptomyces antimicrobicus]